MKTPETCVDPTRTGNTAKARILYRDGRIVDYDNPSVALEVYYGLPRGTRAAFRAVGDETPVYPHDYVDK